MATGTSTSAALQCKVESLDNSADRLQIYQTVLSELKTLDVNSNSPVAIDVDKKTELIHGTLHDITGTHLELAVVAQQVLTYCLRWECLTNCLSEEFSSQIVTTLCDLVQSTTDKITCARIFQCFAGQTLKRSVLAQQLEQVLTAIKNGQCHKNFQSTQVEYDALSALSRLLDQLPSEMAEKASTWAPLVYPLVLHANVRVRERALVAMEKGMAAMMTQQNDVARALASDLKDFLVKELERRMDAHEEIHTLLMWCCYVRLLGTVLHRNSLCNRLLPIVERGFKHPDQDVKIAAFGAWQALIDNFALVDDYLCEHKRVRLIMQVFSSVQIRSEPLALMKFRVWWHFVRRLGDKATGLFDQVIVPLLRFCFGVTVTSIPGSASKLGFKSPIAAKPVESPVVPAIASPLGLLSPNAPSSMRSFPSLHRFGCEALTMMLVRSNLNETSNLSSLGFTIDLLDHDVICRSATFAKYSATILACVRFCMVTLAGDVAETMLLSLWHAVVRQVCNLLEQPDNTLKNEKCEAFTALLGTLREVVAAQSFKPDVMLSLIQEVTTQIPQRVLASSSYSIDSSSSVMQGCPALVLIELIFSHRVMEICSGSECFRELIGKLLRIGLINTAGALGFYQSVFDLLSRSAGNVEQLEVLGQIWLIIAASLNEHINKTNEVNQGNNLEHDFNCMHTALLFPVIYLFKDHLPQITANSVLKLWEKLYASFARLSSMVVNVEANIGCEEFAGRVLSAIGELNLKGATFWLHVSDLLKVIIESYDFSSTSTPVSLFAIGINSPTKSARRKAKLLGNMHSLVGIELKLLTEVVTDLNRQGDVHALTDCLPTLVSFIAALFQHKQSWSWLTTALSTHAEKLGELYKLSSSGPPAIFSQKLLQKLEKLWISIAGCIQTNANGEIDSDFLATLSPLLSSVLSHSRRTLRMQAVKFWNQTFALSTVLKYPSCLKPVMAQLKEKNLIMLPSWDLVHIDVVADTPMNDLSQIELPDSEVIVPNVPGVPFCVDVPSTTIQLSPRKSVGSFLQRVQCESPAKPATHCPTVTPRRSLKGPASSPSVSSLKSTPGRKSSSKPDALFDMSTQDFVPIANTAGKKQHVLTEHQREMMREKKVLPAMYNNLDATSQASHDIFSHFNVDSSQSQMEMRTAGVSSALGAIKVLLPEDGNEVQALLICNADDDLTFTKDRVVPDETMCLTGPLQSAAVPPYLEEVSPVGPFKVCSVRLRRLSNEEIADNQKPIGDLTQSCSSFANDLTKSPFKVGTFPAVEYSSPGAKQDKSETSGRNSTPFKKTVRGVRQSGATAGETPTRQLKIVDMLSYKSPNIKQLADTGEQCKSDTVRKSLCVSGATKQLPFSLEVLVEDSQLPMSCAVITSEESDGPDILPMCIEETPPSDSLECIESSAHDASSRQSSVSKRLFPGRVEQRSCLSDNIEVSNELEPAAELTASLNKNPAMKKLAAVEIAETGAPQTVVDALSQNNKLLKVDDNVVGSTSRQEVSIVQSDIVVETLSPSEFVPTAIKPMPPKKGRPKKSTGVSDALSKQVTSCVECDVTANTITSMDIQPLTAVPESSSLDTILAVKNNKATSTIATRKRAKQRISIDYTVTTSADNSVDLDSSEVINQADLPTAKSDTRVDELKGSSKSLTLLKSSRRQSGSEKRGLAKNVEQETSESSEVVQSVEPSKSISRQREIIDSNVSDVADLESEADENMPLSNLSKSKNAGLQTRRKSSSCENSNSSKLSASDNLKSISTTVESNSGTVTAKILRTLTSQNDSTDNSLTCNGSVSSLKMDVSMETDSDDDLPLSSLSGSSLKAVTSSQSIKSDGRCVVVESISSSDLEAIDQNRKQSSYLSPKSEDDDLPLKCFSRTSVCEDKQQVCQPDEFLQRVTRRRKSHIPVRSPDRHLHTVTKASMKTNIYLRQNKLNLRSKAFRQKASEVLLSGKSAIDHVFHRSKINTRSRKKPDNIAADVPGAVVTPNVKAGQLMQFVDNTQISVVQQDPIRTARDNSDCDLSIANSVTTTCKDETNATLLTVDLLTEKEAEDVITIDDSQEVNDCHNSELNEVDECVSLIVGDNRPVTVEQQDECASLNTYVTGPCTVEKRSEYVSEDTDCNQHCTVEQPSECISLDLDSDQSYTKEPLSACSSLDAGGNAPLAVESLNGRIFKNADTYLTVPAEPVVSSVVLSAEALPNAVSVNTLISQSDLGFDELSIKLATTSDKLDVNNSELQNENLILADINMQVDDDVNQSITTVHKTSMQSQKNGVHEAGQVVGSGDFVVPVVASTSLNSECLELTNTSTQVGDSANVDTVVNLSPDILQKTTVKFAMPVDRLPVCSSEAPPETPTSASRKTFTSRGSLMVQRAKQMQKAGSVVSSKPMEEGSPSTVERSKSLFLQRVYSPSASPSASILRKRHLIVTESSIESPSPPNKQRRVCFNDCIETREIPSRRCNTAEDNDVTIVRKQRLAERSSITNGLDFMSARPVNRQLELPGQQTVCRTKKLVAGAGLRFGGQQRGRFMVVPSPKPEGTADKIDQDNLLVTSNSDYSNTLQSANEDIPAHPATAESQDLDATPGSSLQPVSLQMTQESQLDSTEPIYANLMDCSTSVKVVLHKLTTPPWVPALEKYLRSMNILSVGDLCSLTEQEVHHLPIAQPKISTVRHALDKFAEKYRRSCNSYEAENNDSFTTDNAPSVKRLVKSGCDQLYGLLDQLAPEDLADVFKMFNALSQKCVERMCQKK